MGDIDIVAIVVAEDTCCEVDTRSLGILIRLVPVVTCSVDEGAKAEPIARALTIDVRGVEVVARDIEEYSDPTGSNRSGAKCRALCERDLVCIVAQYVHIGTSCDVSIVSGEVADHACSARSTKSLGLCMAAISVVTVVVKEQTDAKYSCTLGVRPGEVGIITLHVMEDPGTEQTTSKGEVASRIDVVTTAIDEDPYAPYTCPDRQWPLCRAGS
jgi:hypothetical protein